ncbi:unnamed protein product [Nezara viridula]|uniref:RGS domain-containing protein n=1 Tax=Nezara viridula TaxID=85310 RepID=A0A9P0EBR6_NEZVI|nr:unnamed protein product [Nezara viridula]
MTIIRPIWTYGVELLGSTKPSSNLAQSRYLSFHNKLQNHPNSLVSNLASSSIPDNPPRRLKRRWPRDLLIPSLDEIRCWGKSFDKLMRNSAGRKVFREFLRCEYSEENILFWLACEELKREGNPDLIEEKARFIYEDYISILSPKEVY